MNNRKPYKGERQKSNVPTPPRINSLFQSDGKSINPELLDSEAENWAVSICNNRELPNHQLRRFFGEFKQLQRRLGTDESRYPDKWPQVYPRIKMLKSQANYARNRKTSSITDNFYEFIVMLVDLSKSAEEFIAVCTFFEAVVGYSAGKVKDR